ncbi:ABC transporter substrate-binding protein [Candidatus Halobeggiatoa sp. HSG11]|nr:ABC transporter substrate-binding protein [Candidatus Halobeggiatoa sp. HSG11]
MLYYLIRNLIVNVEQFQYFLTTGILIMMKKQLLLITLLLVMSSSVFAKTYKLGIVEWLPWGIAYVAAEQGFWKAEGIEVQIKQFADYETENLKAFENGKTDFMLSMLGNAIEMLNKKPNHTIIYESNWSHGGDFFIVHKDITSLSQLKGKKIGLYTNSAPISFFASKVLATDGLNVDDVKLLKIANTKDLNSAFNKGRISAIISYDPEASKVIKTGVGKLLYTSADFAGIIPEGISVQNTVLQNNPEDVKKFLRGWLQAIKWHNENKQEFYAILKRTMFKDSSYTDKDLDELYAGSKIHTDLPTIINRNQQGILKYSEELFAYLGIKVEQLKGNIQTKLSVNEAKLIFK